MIAFYLWSCVRICGSLRLRNILVEEYDSAQRLIANTIAFSDEQNTKLESLLAAERLDDSQKQAIRLVLTHRFYMIQGPPGTDKTTTNSALVYILLDPHVNGCNSLSCSARDASCSAHDDERSVLVFAPSNIAVDTIALRLINSNHAAGKKIRRSGPKMTPGMEQPLRDIFLPTLCKGNAIDGRVIIDEELLSDEVDAADVVAATSSAARFQQKGT